MGKDEPTLRVVVQVDCEKKLLYITNQTTCGDVIKMVTKDYEYEMTETLNGVERILNQKCKISKATRSMGKNGFLSISKSGEAVTKRPCIGRGFRKLKEMRTLVKNLKSSQHKKKDSSVLQGNRNVSDNKLHIYKDKSVNGLRQNYSTCKLNKGKLDIMKRYLEDCDSHINNTVSCMDDLETPLTREEGDGDSGTPKCPRTRGDGASHDESFFSSFTRYNTCIDITRYNTCIDIGPPEESSDDFNNTTTEILDFNTAFVEDRDSLCEYSGSDVSIDEHEINIIDEGNGTDNKYEVMSTWFADDDAMESFMQTVIEQDRESDEGVSSMSSDNGGSDKL